MSTTKICPTCRKREYVPGDKYCEWCGHRVPPAGANEKVWVSRRAETRSSAGPVAAAYFSVTAALIAGIVYLVIMIAGNRIRIPDFVRTVFLKGDFQQTGTAVSGDEAAVSQAAAGGEEAAAQTAPAAGGTFGTGTAVGDVTDNGVMGTGTVPEEPAREAAADVPGPEAAVQEAAADVPGPEAAVQEAADVPGPEAPVQEAAAVPAPEAPVQETPAQAAVPEAAAPEAAPAPVIHSYEYHARDFTWSDALANAREKGGYLLHIDSEEELNKVLADISRLNYQNVIFFIGARRDPGTSAYYWVNADNQPAGEAINSDSYWLRPYWMSGEPSFSDAGREEEYVEMYYSDAEGRWVLNDVPNDIISIVPEYSGRVGFIIEYG